MPAAAVATSSVRPSRWLAKPACQVRGRAGGRHADHAEQADADRAVHLDAERDQQRHDDQAAADADQRAEYAGPDRGNRECESSRPITCADYGARYDRQAA